MSVRRSHPPKCRLHKPTGQAVVTLNGRDYYLGKHGSSAALAEYDRRVAEWLANGRRVIEPATTDHADDKLTVGDMLVAYVQHADIYYRKDGKPTTEPKNIRSALRPLRRLYGQTPAEKFGPLALQAVRSVMVSSGLCRNEVNGRVRHLVRCFKWATKHEMIPPSVHHGLVSVDCLKAGRCEARESSPVGPVSDALVDAVQRHVSRQVWAMVEIQRLTGARSGEVCQMRTRDIDRSGDVWIYTPQTHKTSHLGKQRPIAIGPKGQRVLAPWLRADPDTFLFQPREAMEEYRSGLRKARKTKVQPSQAARKRKRRPDKAPGERYTTQSYGRAIDAGSDRAFPHPTLSKISAKDRTPEQRAELKAWRKRYRWHPHQLRHNAATNLRRQFDLDTARAILGHSTTTTTEIYAERDQAKAIDVMRLVG